jgi:quercetin dioxygenase-like cupin family protein
MGSTRPQLPAKEPAYDSRFVQHSPPTSFLPNISAYSKPFPQITTLYNNPIPNCPGKSIVGFKIDFPPSASTPPHTHAGAFVAVQVVSGYVYNKMNDAPMAIFGPGESFFENPGCHHRISDNASATEPAQIVANLIVDTKVVEEGGVMGLVVIDEEYREAAMQAMARAAAAAGAD